jgi:cell division protein FtsZ
VQATHAALGSPLMDMRRIRWASGVLLHVQAGPQLPIRQVEAAARLVGGLAPESADMRMGVTLSGTLGDRARATIVLTGIRQQQTRLSIPASRPSAWPPRREVAQVAYAA